MLRAALATSILACTLLAPDTSVAAGAVVPRSEHPDAAFVDVRMAVAVTPAGSTRWSEVTVPAATAAMWLVPVRPGAAIDWAPRRWLDALDDATSPRILPPSYSSTCPSRSAPENAAPWTTPRPAQPAPALSVHTSADSARAYVAERGYRLDPALAGRISDLYASGWNLVALEIASSSSELSSGTLRVSDHGGAVLPLALSGSSSTRVTVFAIGAGLASVAGARDVDRYELRWGPGGSTFVAWRRSVVEGGHGLTWLRESGSHAALFDGTRLPGGSSIASTVAGYLQGASCTSATAQSLGTSRGIVGTSCAPGAAARVPGGAGCTPASGDIDPAALSCGPDVDLAMALSGLAPASAVVTRLVGWVPAGAFGADLGLTLQPDAPAKPPAMRADKYEACGPAAIDHVNAPAPLHPGPSLSSGSGSGSTGDEYVPTSDGCGGSTVATGTTTYEEEPAPEEPPATDGCSGDGSSSGWDDGDTDDGDSGESCSTDGSWGGGSSSSSGGDGDDGWDGDDGDDGWDSDDGDDGWDTEDGMGPRGKKLRPAPSSAPHAKTTKKKSSPVSRYALLAAALLLPLRRRRRGPESE